VGNRRYIVNLNMTDVFDRPSFICNPPCEKGHYHLIHWCDNFGVQNVLLVPGHD
jgi:hypothetical protein